MANALQSLDCKMQSSIRRHTRPQTCVRMHADDLVVEKEVSMSKTCTECYKLSFDSVITVHQLNHEQSILVIRARSAMWSQANRPFFYTLCISLCVCINFWHNLSFSCGSSLTQVKCCTPTTALQVTDWWACSCWPTCGSATLCWSLWSTTRRNSLSTSLSSPHTHYGKTCTAPPHLYFAFALDNSTWAWDCRSTKIHICSVWGLFNLNNLCCFVKRKCAWDNWCFSGPEMKSCLFYSIRLKHCVPNLCALL